MFSKIRVISIPVSDQQAARRFYTEILGGKVEADLPLGPDGNGWVLQQPPAAARQG